MKTFFLFVLMVSVSAETFYVTPSLQQPCPSQSMQCLLLSQYATMMPVSGFPSNTTLVLLPGNHSLDLEFTVANSTSFSIIADNNAAHKTKIMCGQSGRFRFESNTNVVIRGLELNGCSGNTFTSADEVTIDNCTFLGLGIEANSGALLLFSIENAQILSTYIQSYIVTSLTTDDLFLFDHPSGSIHISNSNVTIYDVTFTNNTVIGNGGGINIVGGSTVTITSSEFTDLEAISGGAISVAYSDIEIDETTFRNSSADCGGAMYLYGSGVCTIRNSKFVGTRGLYTGVVFTNFYSLLEIENSFFNNNVALGDGGALLMLGTSLSIHNSTFTNNMAQRGGAISFTGSATGVEVPRQGFNISDTSINNNMAYFSGAIHLESADFISSGFLDIQNNTATMVSILYILNSSAVLSGNTTISNNEGSVYVYTSSVMFDGLTSISSNRRSGFMFALEGGGISSFQSEISLVGEVNIVSNRNDISNSQNGGAILAAESQLHLDGDVVILGNSASASGGAIYAYQCEINFKNSITISDNVAAESGGGIYAAGTRLTLTEGSLRFINNVAYIHGGGIFFSLNAKFYSIKRQNECNERYECSNLNPDEWLRLEFTNNSANYGGALFVDDSANSGTCGNSVQTSLVGECFFQTLSLYNMNENYNGSNLLNTYFTNNSAGVAGRSLFGGLMDRCSASPFAETSTGNEHIVYNIAMGSGLSGAEYFSTITNVSPSDISSHPVRVCVCENNRPVCSGIYSEYNPNLVFSARKGQNFTVSLVAVDQVDNIVPAVVRSSLNSGSGRLGDNQFSQNTFRHCTELNYNVFSPYDSEVINVYAEGPCNEYGMSQLSLKVHFLPCECPFGFEVTYNHTDCICGCDSRLEPYVTNCNIDKMSVIRNSDVWLGNDNYTGYIICPVCPLDYCKDPSKKVAINLNEVDGSDAQCAFNRSGILCGGCSNNLSVVFGSSRCMSCDDKSLGLLVVFAIAGVVLVAFILVCNLTVAVGTINGLIFYANVAAVNRAALLPFGAPNFSVIFLAWLNIDFGFEACFIENMDMYTRTWLGLVFPAYIIVLVIMIIVVSSYSTWFSKLLSNKNPVATLATLIILSYANVLSTIITVFSSATVEYSIETNVRVWLIDGNIRYLKGKHIYIVVVAALIIVIGFVYTFFLFSWQWLMQCPNTRALRWIANTKVYSFMDTYNAPYNTKYRYWTGLLLLVRVILYTVLVIDVGNNPNVGLFIVTSICCGLLVLKDIQRERVYKYWLLNILENSFLFNAILFTGGTNHISTVGGNQAALAHISVGIAFITFFLILVYHTFAFVIPKRLTEKLLRLLSRLSHKKPKPTKGSVSGVERNFQQLRKQLEDLPNDIEQNDVTVDNHYYQQAKDKPPKPQDVTHTVIDGIPSEKDVQMRVLPH